MSEYRISLPPIPSADPKTRIYAVDTVSPGEQSDRGDQEPPSTERDPASKIKELVPFKQRIKDLSEHNRDLEGQLQQLAKVHALESNHIPNNDEAKQKKWHTLEAMEVDRETIQTKLEISQVKQIWMQFHASLPLNEAQQALEAELRATAQQLADALKEEPSGTGDTPEVKIRKQRVRLRALSELAQELSS